MRAYGSEFDAKLESESDTKLRIIEALKQCGWDNDHMRFEYSLASDRYCIVPEQNKTEVVKSSRQRPDLILFRSSYVPLAVVEFKRFSFDDAEGIDQAKSYAQRLGLPFAFSSSGHGFVEFDFISGEQRHLALEQFPTPEELWRRYCEAKSQSGGYTEEKISNLSRAQYYTSGNSKEPRYYQMVAINEVVNAILLNKQKRLLLVMATGTGKTYTAFQIVWRLLRSGEVQRVLYLADRTQLIDQSMVGDFAPLGKDVCKISRSQVKKNYKVYFGLYQQLKNAHGADGGSSSCDADDYEETAVDLDLFKQFPSDFFDLVIVDECHRGSAREQSAWREILSYFGNAVQLGLTATPNNKEDANNIEYFGEPIFSYSLKQGTDDGYLAPFQVLNVLLDKDQSGWEPYEGELDDYGKPIPKRRYTVEDFDHSIILPERIKLVAQYINDLLQQCGAYSKTIVFCATQKHALMMRDELRSLNSEKMRENANYIVRMTSDDEDGRSLYQDFCSSTESFPVVVTTSKLLSTGADTKCVKLIVLDSNISSEIEFRQIIGRGTRLVPAADKTFFTILDFRGVCKKFLDSDFDGEPSWIKDYDRLSGQNRHQVSTPHQDRNKKKQDATIKREVFVVSNVEVSIVGTTVSFFDEHGKLVETTLEEYTKQRIVKNFATIEEFFASWNQAKSKGKFLAALDNDGVKLPYIKEQLHYGEMDDYDIVAHLGYGGALRLRRDRAKAVRESNFLRSYTSSQQAIIDSLLDVYESQGVSEIENVSVLRKGYFSKFGKPPKIIKTIFAGERDAFLQTLDRLKSSIYTSI